MNQKIGLIIVAILLLSGCLFLPAAVRAQEENQPNENKVFEIVPERVEQYRLADFIKGREAFKTAWQSVVGILDILVFIAFIVFALANIFHIKYEEYQIKKVLPGLIVGIILANLSYSICLFFIDFAQNLTNLFIGTPEKFIQNMVDLYSWLWYLGGIGAIGAGAFSIIVAPLDIAIVFFILLLFLLPVLLLLAVGIILWTRAYIILALVIFSPLAFFLYFFKLEIPGLSSLSQKWMDWFIRWLITGPIIFAIFWVGFMLNNAARGRLMSQQIKQPAIAKIQNKTREFSKEVSTLFPLKLKTAQAAEENNEEQAPTTEESTQNESSGSESANTETGSSNIINIRTLEPKQTPHKLDYFAFGLGFLISLLAVVVPFGMASGLLNEMGQITGPLKDIGKKAYKYSGLQRSLRKGAYGLLQKPQVRKTMGVMRYNLVGKDKELEEGLSKQIEQTDKEFREKRYLTALVKNKGNVKAIDPVLVDAIKRSGGEDLAKASDYASQPVDFLSKRLEQLNAGKLFEAIKNGDETLLRDVKPEDIGEIRAVVSALIRKLSSFNVKEKNDAEKALGELASTANITSDQLLMTDLRTFNMPKETAPRPDSPVADQPQVQKIIEETNEEFENPQAVSVNPESIRELGDKIADKINIEIGKAQILGNQIRSIIGQRETILGNREKAISTIKSELEMARDLLSRGDYEDAVSIMQNYHLPAAKKPDEILEKALVFLESSAKEKDEQQAMHNYKIEITNRTINEETRRIVNRITGKRGVSLSSNDIQKIAQGQTPESVSPLSDQEQQKLRQIVQGVVKEAQSKAQLPPPQTESKPSSSPLPQSRNEYYQQIDKGRDKYVQYEMKKPKQD